MKRFISVATAVALGIVLNGCGPESVDINIGGDGSSTQSSIIKGRFVDSPVEGIKYLCGDGTDGLTDETGLFKCQELPVKFMVGKVILGEMQSIPADKIVTPQDLAGVARDSVDDKKVSNIARFLQSLDDDGLTEDSITIDDEVASNLEKDIDIKELEDDSLENLLEEAGVPLIVSKDEALEHLKKHTDTLDEFKSRFQNDEPEDVNSPKNNPIKTATTSNNESQISTSPTSDDKKDETKGKSGIKEIKKPQIEIPKKPTPIKPTKTNMPVKPVPTQNGSEFDTKKRPTDTKINTSINKTGKVQYYIIDNQRGVATGRAGKIVWQNSQIGHGTREEAIKFCQDLNLAGISNWRLPTSAESRRFHKYMNKQGTVPKQAFSKCTAEVTKNGYIKTLRGTKEYGGEVGDSINFTGEANIRCVSSTSLNTKNSKNDQKNSQNSTKSSQNNNAIINVTPLNDDFKASFLKAMNDARSRGRECGEFGYFDPAPPLRWNDKLYISAYRHSYDMAKTDTFSHTGSGKSTDLASIAFHPGEGSSMKERIDYAGYKNWRKIGENIAAGTNMNLAQKAIDAWIKSPTHCKNLMNPEFTEVGLARVYDTNSHYKYYWTQDFGMRK